jgi:hypothetical protein
MYIMILCLSIYIDIIWHVLYLWFMYFCIELVTIWGYIYAYLYPVHRLPSINTFVSICYEKQQSYIIGEEVRLISFNIEVHFRLISKLRRRFNTLICMVEWILLITINNLNMQRDMFKMCLRCYVIYHVHLHGICNISNLTCPEYLLIYFRT